MKTIDQQIEVLLNQRLGYHWSLNKKRKLAELLKQKAIKNGIAIERKTNNPDSISEFLG